MSWFRRKKPKILSCPFHEDYCFEEVDGVEYYFLQECGCNHNYHINALPEFRPRGKLVDITVLCIWCLNNETTFKHYENRRQMDKENMVCDNCKPKEKQEINLPASWNMHPEVIKMRKQLPSFDDYCKQKESEVNMTIEDIKCLYCKRTDGQLYNLPSVYGHDSNNYLFKTCSPCNPHDMRKAFSDCLDEIERLCGHCNAKNKCKGCNKDIEVDIKLGYCASCVAGKVEVEVKCQDCKKPIESDGNICHPCFFSRHNACRCNCSWGCQKNHYEHRCCHKISKLIEEAKMKEFDLRPFEVMPRIVEERFVLWRINTYGVTKKEEKIDCKKFSSYVEGWDWVKQLFIKNELSHQTYEHPGYFSYFLRRETGLKPWTFSDIEIGCFFKVVTQGFAGAKEGVSICLKTSATDFSWIYDYKMIDGSVDRFLVNYGALKAQDYERLEIAKFKITNVYKCDELYKHFMIEELKS